MTMSPLIRPRTNPVNIDATQHQSIGTPLSYNFASTPALAASVDATERSISPLMITNVKARASKPISIYRPVLKIIEEGSRKYSEPREP
jgi:hypothetical protein